jgi:hypothetical protein
VRTSSPESQAAGLKVGDIVENFSAVVRVEALDPERGALVKIIPFIRDNVAQGGVGQRYYAAPNLCRVLPR